MQASSLLCMPLNWIQSFIVKFAKGVYSIPVTMMAAFLLFSLGAVMIECIDDLLRMITINTEWIKHVRVSCLAVVVLFLHLGIWNTAAQGYWWFRMVLRLLVINNVVVFGIFLLATVGLIRIDEQVVMRNPNVPTRIR